ncbi:hypothetical protein, partial [Streptococcus suis]
IAPRNQLLIELSKTLWMSGIGEFRSLWWDGSRGFTIGKQTGFYGDRRKYLSKYTDEIVEIHYDVENNQIQSNYSIRDFEWKEFLGDNESRIS